MKSTFTREIRWKKTEPEKLVRTAIKGKVSFKDDTSKRSYGQYSNTQDTNDTIPSYGRLKTLLEEFKGAVLTKMHISRQGKCEAMENLELIR